MNGWSKIQLLQSICFQSAVCNQSVLFKQDILASDMLLISEMTNLSKGDIFSPFLAKNSTFLVEEGFKRIG